MRIDASWDAEPTPVESDWPAAPVAAPVVEQGPAVPADVYQSAAYTAEASTVLVSLPFAEDAGSSQPAYEPYEPAELADMARSMAAQLASPTFEAADPALAASAANALSELSAAANEATAEQLAPAIGYWVGIAQECLDSGQTTAAPDNLPAPAQANSASSAGDNAAFVKPSSSPETVALVSAYLSSAAVNSSSEGDWIGLLPPAIAAQAAADGGNYTGHAYLVDASGGVTPGIIAQRLDTQTYFAGDKGPTRDEDGTTTAAAVAEAMAVPVGLVGQPNTFVVTTNARYQGGNAQYVGGDTLGVGFIDPALVGWTQLPTEYTLEVNDVINELGRANGVADTKLPDLRAAIYTYDSSFGVLVPTEIADAAAQLYESRHPESSSWFEKLVTIGVMALLTYVTAGAAAGVAASFGASAFAATVVGQGAAAALMTGVTGGGVSDFAATWAGMYVGGQLGAAASGAASGAVSVEVAAGIGAGTSSAVRQIVTTGKIDPSLVLAAAGGAAGAASFDGSVSTELRPLVDGAAQAVATLVATGNSDAALAAFVSGSIGSLLETQTPGAGPVGGSAADGQARPAVLFDDNGMPLLDANGKPYSAFTPYSTDLDVSEETYAFWAERAAARAPLIGVDVPANVAAVGELAVLPISTTTAGSYSPAGSGVLARAVYDGQPVVVLLSVNHVWLDDNQQNELGEGGTGLLARAHDGSMVDIPLGHVISNITVSDSGGVSLGYSGDNKIWGDGVAVVLPQETVDKLLSAADVARLPGLATSTPAPGDIAYSFGFPGFTNPYNADKTSSVDARLLVGSTLTIEEGHTFDGDALGGNNLIATLQSSSQNPPQGHGSSGGALLGVDADGQVVVQGVYSRSLPNGKGLDTTTSGIVPIVADPNVMLQFDRYPVRRGEQP